MAVAHPSESLKQVVNNNPREAKPRLEELISHLQNVLLERQEKDGHWHFALDDNTTMNSEFIMFHRWLGIENEELIRRLAQHLLDTQDAKTGSWNLYEGAAGNLSCTVEAYFALLLAGFSKQDEPLRKAKAFILSEGGIPKARVFTKIWLALFKLFPWEGVPIIPPEIMLAPKQIPFNILEFSYWSRVTIIPLTILFHLQQTRQVAFHLDELYVAPEDKFKTEFNVPPPVDDSWILKPKGINLSWINWEQVFVALNKGVTVYETHSPLKPLRGFALQKAKRWILDHQESSGDWGGIQPPMLNSIMALHAMGMPLYEAPIQKGLESLHRFTRGVSPQIHRRETNDAAVLQSCVSPIWDTALGALALLESGMSPQDARLQKTRDWLWKMRITHRGDWVHKAKLKRGKPFAAWCFQYHNSNYPDVDDSAMVTFVLHKLGMTKEELEPAIHWLYAMQNSDGGWGTFDRDNNQYILNRIPFADLKSLIDPSNPDVSGHVLETLGELGLHHTPEVRRAIRYMKRVQKPDGSWFGRWGVNYIYGTCAAIVGLRKVGEPAQAAYLQKAAHFLLSKQNKDGGWGESCGSYGVDAPHGEGDSTPSQTAWALMSLHALGITGEEVNRAVAFLETRKVSDGLFEKEFTGTGFPQHFYLRYDGYRTYFPLIALGRLKQIQS